MGVFLHFYQLIGSIDVFVKKFSKKCHAKSKAGKNQFRTLLWRKMVTLSNKLAFEKGLSNMNCFSSYFWRNLQKSWHAWNNYYQYWLYNTYWKGRFAPFLPLNWCFPLELIRPKFFQRFATKNRNWTKTRFWPYFNKKRSPYLTNKFVFERELFSKFAIWLKWRLFRFQDYEKNPSTFLITIGI